MAVCVLVVLITSTFAVIGGDAFGVNFALTRTCEHAYGSVIYALSYATSLIECAVMCDRLETCRSSLYRHSTSVCTLNNGTVAPGTFPADCGVSYLEWNTRASPANVSGVPYGGECTTNASCTTNGGICLNFNCTCNPGLTYDATRAICTTNSSDCSTVNYCFLGKSVDLPWADNTTHLRTNMDCNTTFPNGTLLAGQLRVAVLTDVTAVVEPFYYGTKMYISDLETIFTTAYDETSPFLFEFQIVYLGQILSWNGTIPICDNPIPNVQCRLLF